MTMDALPTTVLQTKAPDQMVATDIPTMRSFIVLRREVFGGLLFNPYLPPHVRLDRIRFKIASLCDGAHTLAEIRSELGNDLQQRTGHLDHFLRSVLASFNEKYALFWRRSKASEPRDFRIRELSDEAKERPGGILSVPASAIWAVTNACNLRCAHCLSSSGKRFANELTTDEAKRVIDTLHDLQILTLNFSGGEPLARHDIHELLEYASGKHLAIELMSNGALIDEKVVERLQGTDVFHVQISLDGMEETHDRFRGVPGSFRRSVRAIQLLQEAGFGVNISMTVTQENIDELFDVVDFAIVLGVKLFKTLVFLPAGRGKGKDGLALDAADVKRLSYMIEWKRRQAGDAIHLNKDQMYSWLMNGHRCAAPRGWESKTLGCPAGTSLIYIDPEGRIAPCSFLQDLSAGNIRDTDLQEAWDRSEVFQMFRGVKNTDIAGPCSTCEFAGNECKGGCRAAAYISSGDLFTTDPMCWYHAR